MIVNTPTLNATGLFRLALPFVLVENKIYTCEATAGFEALESQDVDVFKEYYEPFGINQAKFKEDRDARVDIVTLMSDTEETVYVPSSYIVAYPSTQSVKYARTIIGVDIGMLPHTVGLGPLTEEIKAIVEDMIGHKATVSLNVSSIKGEFSYEEHVRLEAARIAEVKYSNSIRTRLREALASNEELRNRVAALEEIIVNN